MLCFNNILFINLVSDGTPRIITLTATNPAMLSVTYTPPELQFHNGNVTGYVIRYTTVGTINSMMINVSKFSEDSQTSNIPGVMAFTNYSVEVTLVNVNGTGPFSDPVFGLSGEDGKQESKKMIFWSKATNK